MPNTPPVNDPPDPTIEMPLTTGRFTSNTWPPAFSPDATAIANNGVPLAAPVALSYSVTTVVVPTNAVRITTLTSRPGAALMTVPDAAAVQFAVNAALAGNPASSYWVRI